MYKRKQRSRKAMRDARYNRTDKGKARVARWRDKKRPEYLAYLRRYHRSRRRVDLRRTLSELERAYDAASTKASRERIRFKIQEINHKLKGLKIAEDRDKRAS